MKHSLCRNRSRAGSPHLVGSLAAGLVLAITFLAAAEPVPIPPDVGPDWIQNARSRVQLFRSETGRHWRLDCQRRDAPGAAWVPVATAAIVGTCADEKRMQAIRTSCGVYCLFEKCLPENLETGLALETAFLRFRLRREELWADIRVSLLRDTGFIQFECIGRSHPFVMPHGSLSLPLPLTLLTADRPGDPGAWQDINARDHRGEYIHVDWSRFAALYRRDHPLVYFLLQAPNPDVRHVMFSPGGFSGAWLDCPYAFCAVDYTGSREAETIQHLGRRTQNAYRKAIAAGAAPVTAEPGQPKPGPIR